MKMRQRKCRNCERLSKRVAELEKQLAAALARIEELERQLPGAPKEFFDFFQAAVQRHCQAADAQVSRRKKAEATARWATRSSAA